MADEEVVVVTASAAASAPTGSAPLDHKRKLEDLDPPAAAEPPLDLNVYSEEPGAEEEANISSEPDGDAASEAKRPRIEDKQGESEACENGYKTEVAVNEEAVNENTEEHPISDTTQLQGAEDVSNEAPQIEKHEQLSTDIETASTQNLSDENPQSINIGDMPSEEQKEPSLETTQHDSSELLQEPPSTDAQTTRKMEVPNNKVGVLIGKSGDTIRYLQYNSGAKIQITRDSDADPHSTARPVELIGTLENINKAEKLIKDVIAEADAGGSPALVARGFAAAQSTGAGEQILIQVPNEKVGLIIGKGGETIKNLQTRSGARIQLIPQHLPEGDQSRERTVRVTGDRRQIETAREMIKEVMSQPVRSSFSGGYNQQQGYRPRGPTQQWGSRGPHPGQPISYEYQHRGPHSSHNPQYGNYPLQQAPPRGGYVPGWEHRPPSTMQGPPHGGGYDYYGPGGGHMAEIPNSAPHSTPYHAHGPGPSANPMGPPSQANYNYGQPQGAEYGQPAPYSQMPTQQGYGHGYEEPKYDNPASMQPPYGVHGNSHPNYQQPTAHSGFPSQQQYGRPPSYGMQSQGPPPQSYGTPRAQPGGDAPYQGSYPQNQSYGTNVPPQQPYPYSSSGPMQQSYPPYGSASASDGYSQPPPASSQQSYTQGMQPVSGFGQAGGQPNYAQGPQGGYAQPGYAEQPVATTANNAAYGYQAPAEPNYNSSTNSAYVAPANGQQGYAQPVPTQPNYEQSAPPAGGAYVGGPVGAPVNYTKSVSPQPGYTQYDPTQVYGAQR